MTSSIMRDKILEEIQHIPEARLAEVYDFIHYFRLGLEKAGNADESIMRFAGSWQDMPDDVFNELEEDLASRRKQAFSERRSRETGFD